LHRKLNLRGFSRLLVGLFAVQVLAAGFCLMAPETHAANAHEMQMPLSSEMASHCDNGVKTDSDHAESACAHCDQPDELVNKVSVFNIDVELPLSILTSNEARTPAPLSIDLSVRTPTGPPHSSSLLYQYSQRILI